MVGCTDKSFRGKVQLSHTLHYDIHVCNTAGAIRKKFSGSCWNVLIQVNGKRGGGAESNAYERKNMEAHERGGKGTEKKNSGNRILTNRQGEARERKDKMHQKPEYCSCVIHL